MERSSPTASTIRLNDPCEENDPSINSYYSCNKKHRNKHQNTYALFKSVTNNVLGRHLVATTDIPAGTVIMRQKPFILGPKLQSYPLCLGCHKHLNSVTEYTCSKCAWPLCNKDCENSNLHVDECRIFEKCCFRPAIQFDDCKTTEYFSITPLRLLLLKQNDKSKYESLIQFQSHLEENLKTSLYNTLQRILVPIFTQKLELDTNSEEILTICSILDTNAFDVRDAKGKVNIRGLYPIVNLLAHDCKHNTKHSFHGDDFEMVLTSTMPIKKGEVITITYTQTLWGTLTRRAHLKQVKHFDCTCERCSDPTEFGTYAGSIYCCQCRRDDHSDNCPKMLSTERLDPGALWKCESCDYIVSGRQIMWINKALKQEIRELEENHPNDYERFLERYEDSLHPTNCHILEVKYVLSQIYGNVEGYTLNELSDVFLERKIQLCQELLMIADILEPGYSRFKGNLLYDLQAAMVAQANRKYNNQIISKQTFLEILCSAAKILKDSANILISEPDMKEVLEEKMLNIHDLNTE